MSKVCITNQFQFMPKTIIEVEAKPSGKKGEFPYKNGQGEDFHCEQGDKLIITIKEKGTMLKEGCFIDIPLNTLKFSMNSTIEYVGLDIVCQANKTFLDIPAHFPNWKLAIDGITTKTNPNVTIGDNQP